MTPTSATTGPTRRRPPGRSGPRQDPERDNRLLESAIELLAEGGYANLTMERAALRAGVGKATVYRRWASPAELAAEAFEHSGIINERAIVTIGSGRLREELVGTLVATAACGSPRPHNRLVAAMLETTRVHPEVTAAIQQRYLSNLFDSAMTVLHRAEQRGDLENSLPRDGSPPMQIEAAIALILHWQIIRGSDISEVDIERIVDDLVLPALIP